MSSPTCDIAVTGIAAISAAGVGADPLRQLLADGGSALAPVPADISPRPGCLWGKADQFRAADFMPPLKARKFDRCSLFTVVAAGMALKNAGIDPAAGPAERVGIALGCGFGGIANSVDFLGGYFARGTEGLIPMLFPNTVPNAPASNASIEHGLKGPNVTQVQRFCSAEAALQMACRFLDEGRADVMLAGGVDELNHHILRGFASTGQLRRWARSFGEGCGLLVLERGESARRRGAPIMATVDGIRTVGRLLPGAEATGLDLLLDATRPDLTCFSGVADELPAFADRLAGVPAISTTPILGRSLAMGGLALVAQILSLQPGQRGLHLAASPEGPYFAIDLRGGDPVLP